MDNYVCDGLIYIYCPYDNKDKIKEMGFKWVAPLRLWCIEEDKFNKTIYNETIKLKVNYQKKDRINKLIADNKLDKTVFYKKKSKMDFSQIEF